MPIPVDSEAARQVVIRISRMALVACAQMNQLRTMFLSIDSKMKLQEKWLGTEEEELNVLVIPIYHFAFTD